MASPEHPEWSQPLPAADSSPETPQTPAAVGVLLFLAPPTPPESLSDPAEDVAPPFPGLEQPGSARDSRSDPRRTRGRGERSAAGDAATGRGGSGGPALRMLKGAREAAAGMKVSDAQIRAVLEDPHDVQPDPTRPQRTQLRRDGLVVVTGHDGMILRLTRRR
jgi:hypothetical protein